MGNTLSDLCIRYARLHAAKEYYEGCTKLINGEIAKMGEQLFRDFADSSQASIRLTGDGVFTDKRDRILAAQVKYKGTIIAHATFYDMLRATNQAALIKTAVAAGTLNKWVTEHKKKNLALPDERVLKVFQIETVKVSRAPRSASDKVVEQEETEGEDTNE